MPSEDPFYLEDEIEEYDPIEVDEMSGAKLQKSMPLRVMSFSYKEGVPDEAQAIVDVRTLPNPHSEPGLKHLDGTHERVKDFVAMNFPSGPYSAFPNFVNNVCNAVVINMMSKNIFDAIGSAEPYTLAFGCTGGRHRSVALAEIIACYVVPVFLSSYARAAFTAMPIVEHTSLGIKYDIDLEHIRRCPHTRKYYKVNSDLTVATPDPDDCNLTKLPAFAAKDKVAKKNMSPNLWGQHSKFPPSSEFHPGDSMMAEFFKVPEQPGGLGTAFKTSLPPDVLKAIKEQLKPNGKYQTSWNPLDKVTEEGPSESDAIKET